MKIALIGYGKMGQAIERIALGRGHSVVAVIDRHNTEEIEGEEFRSADVVIEFTTPDTAVEHYMKCFGLGMPVVSGTTGWLDRRNEVEQACLSNEGAAFFYASNFSVGVYLFDLINKRLAELMNLRTEYDVRMEEVHHIHKKDHPSGTALTLSESIISRIDRKERGVAYLDGSGEAKSFAPDELPIRCIREGEVPGIHRIIYGSAVDSITIEHSAKGREGFALGAVLAAEFLKGKRGIYGMDDLMSAN